MAGAKIRSIFLYFFLILLANDLQILSANVGKLKSFAHCIYFDECNPEDKTKCPSNSASVFFKISKDFLSESISFIFVSNYLKFYTFLFKLCNKICEVF